MSFRVKVEEPEIFETEIKKTGGNFPVDLTKLNPPILKNLLIYGIRQKLSDKLASQQLKPGQDPDSFNRNCRDMLNEMVGKWYEGDWGITRISGSSLENEIIFILRRKTNWNKEHPATQDRIMQRILRAENEQSMPGAIHREAKENLARMRKPKIKVADLLAGSVDSGNREGGEGSQNPL